MGRFLKILIAIIAGVLLAMLVHRHLVTAVSVQDSSASSDVQQLVPETVEGWIDYYAAQYGADPVQMKKVAFCESGYRVAVYGDNGKAFSVAQFHKPTFYKWANEMGEPTLDYYNFQHQIKVMAWAFSRGNSYKDDWSCSHKVGIL